MKNLPDVFKNKQGPFWADKLLDWHKKIDRPMPWKQQKDPYKIWISEIILQQTRVEQGLPYFHKIIEKYPTIEALALADEEEFLSVWEGLGYYSRARNALKTAKYLAFEKQGQFPDTYPELLRLPGIGPYTAAAIASFAFGTSDVVVDGNVARVVSRLLGITEDPLTDKGKKVFYLNTKMLKGEVKASDYNQALMDFGALVCTPHKPHCDTCIFYFECFARKNNQVGALPFKRIKAKRKKRYFIWYLYEIEDKVALSKRNHKDVWRGLFQLPGPEVSDHEGWKKSLKELSQKGNQVYFSKQILTHQEIHLAVVIGIELASQSSEEWIWVQKENLSKMPMPKILRNFLKNHT